MTNLSILLAVLLLCSQTACGAVTAVPGIEIELQNNVHVLHRYYTLGEVAHVTGPDQGQVKRLAGLRLGRTPRVGYSGNVARDDISSQVERSFPEWSQRVTWSGADVIQIRSAKSEYAQGRYVSKGQQYLSEWLAERYDDYELQPAGEYKDVLLPPGDVQLKPSLCRQKKLSKRMCVWIDIHLDGEHYRTLPVWFKVSVSSRVFEVIRDVDAGFSVHHAWVKSSIRDIARVSGSPITLLDQLSGSRLKRAMPAGSVLTAEDFEPLPAVVKGQLVKVYASVGSVKLQVEGKALQDGYRGDRIRLERLDGSDSYAAVVLDEGRVTVDGSM